MLNHGLNFCILPFKIDTTKLLLEDFTVHNKDRILAWKRNYRYKTKYYQNKGN